MEASVTNLYTEGTKIFYLAMKLNTIFCKDNDDSKLRSGQNIPLALLHHRGRDIMLRLMVMLL